MPSSLIFVGLVVLWLLILVPIVARRRQEVPRPGHAARAGRVLRRPARRPGRVEEMDEMQPDKDELDDRDTATVDADRVNEGDSVDEAAEPAEQADDVDEPGATDRGRSLAADSGVDEVNVAVQDDAGADDAGADGAGADGAGADGAGADGAGADAAATAGTPSVPARYRRGRGGFDPEAAALAASARYAFRQRVVLTLLIAALGTGIVAAVGLPVVWYLHGAIDVVLLGYLIYLRRQVRLEDEIRFRRASRLAGTRFAHVGDVPLDGPIETGAFVAPSEATPSAEPTADLKPERAEPGEFALPPLPRAELPGRPIGTAVVGPDDDDPALHPLDEHQPPRYRRAAG